MITTIISDLGGVFLNRGIWFFWSYLNEKYDTPVEAAKLAFLKNYKQYFSGGITEEEFWKNLLSEINLEVDWKLLREKLLGFFELNEDVAKLYKSLREQGLKIILLSDQSKEWWPVLNNKFKISSYFNSVVVSSEIGLSKPNPDIYIYALKIARSKANESVFIDDIDYNLAPARNMGMETVLFIDSMQLEKELKLKLKNG